MVVLLIGVAMLIFGRLEYFFPLAMAYVSFGLFRAVLLGLLDRRQQVPGMGWIPGGRRESDEETIETVGEDTDRFRRRRRRRRSGRSDRLDHEPPSGGSPPPVSPPSPPTNNPR
jgi:hypothetical protein